MSARERIARLLSEVSPPGTVKIDLWEPGATKRFSGMAEWQPEGEPVPHRVVVQGCRQREQVFEELLAGALKRLGRES